ncbi:hypothetical protein GW17_00040619 [Ensete ventricosum]|nr:hypothetical protein GW17_00040619 [Ensete ventricosum]RZR95895.1 hypothetical protein BHM03_00024824 [Ensete ventricosum]
MTRAMELQPNDGPISSLGIGPSSNDAGGPCWEFVRIFSEGIGKLTGNMPGDRRKKTRRLTVRMPEAVGLAGKKGGCQRLSAAELPRWTAEPPIPGFLATKGE